MGFPVVSIRGRRCALSKPASPTHQRHAQQSPDVSFSTCHPDRHPATRKGYAWHRPARPVFSVTRGLRRHAQQVIRDKEKRTGAAAIRRSRHGQSQPDRACARARGCAHMLGKHQRQHTSLRQRQHTSTPAINEQNLVHMAHSQQGAQGSPLGLGPRGIIRETACYGFFPPSKGSGGRFGYWHVSAQRSEQRKRKPNKKTDQQRV